jgi:capsular polysaccharide biosynthesis protein
MDLRDYLSAARRRWLLFAGTTLAVVAVAALALFLMTPQYSSTSRVFISTAATNPNTAYQSGLFSEQRAGSYADLIGGPQISRRVIDDLGLKMSTKTLQDQIHATVVPETVVLKIDVSDPSARQAQNINNSVVKQFLALVRQLETPPGKKTPLLTATVVDPPNLPDSPASPQRVTFLGAAVIVGLLLGFGLAVLRESFDHPPRTGDGAVGSAGPPATRPTAVPTANTN